MNDKLRIQVLEEEVARIKGEMQNLSAQFFKNNSTSTQVFNKDCLFNGRLKVPHYTSAPSVSEVGDLIEVGGVLYICTVANGTFTVVGTQT